VSAYGGEQLQAIATLGCGDGHGSASTLVSNNGTTARLTVRPRGANDTYPPVEGTGTPQGFEVLMALDNGTTLVANVTIGLVVLSTGYYERYTGTVRGGIVGSTQYQGVTLLEQFKFSAT